jgi:hypothetical protein
MACCHEGERGVVALRSPNSRRKGNWNVRKGMGGGYLAVLEQR